ncbi:succinylglutamate desuccinylase/aspartoacylase family protein [Thalassotalea aquiviva]|uniref:succinylglutamate desuccinylase/aspartoacylase domain-containing protein n=1 Tax=Thalassotalea aquiviva TaxID=3242415 RepID=UPI00352ADFD6
MAIDFSELNYLQNPTSFELKSDHLQFLLSISGPVVIDISGKDQGRTRVITTLIHGNEPSGLIAMHQFLSQMSRSQRPVTNLRFIVCSPEVALTKPYFSHRFLPDGKDLNRCFSSPNNTGYYQRANLIKAAIEAVKPEAVFDIHNTSGLGPPFAVAVEKTELALSYASLFCESLILSEIKLGALMEQDFNCQTITIECGGSNDKESHLIALEGLHCLANYDDISQCHFIRNVELYLEPLRLQLKPGCDLHFSDSDLGRSGVTLIDEIEQFNFSMLKQNRHIGWVDELGLNNLQLVDKNGNNLIDQFFSLRGNQIVAKVNLNIFMATKVKAIANQDCIFYLVNYQNHI